MGRWIILALFQKLGEFLFMGSTHFQRFATECFPVYEIIFHFSVGISFSLSSEKSTFSD